jgi:hypothetical protein
MMNIATITSPNVSRNAVPPIRNTITAIIAKIINVIINAANVIILSLLSIKEAEISAKGERP